MSNLTKKLKIIVDMNHPANVHFFKNFIWEMEKRGHEVLVTASDKDITLDLLKKYGFKFINMGSYGKSPAAKILNIPVMVWRMLKVSRKFKPDVFLAGSIRASICAWLLGKKNYYFDDTVHDYYVRMYLPFVTNVYMPTCIGKDFGKKQISHQSYHQLTHLHPNYFRPDKKVLSLYNLKEGDKFFILRFVSWQAVHDVGEKGLSYEGKIRLVKKLSESGRVLITSEEVLPKELQQYKIKVAPEKIHSLMHYATLVISEGGTMASEGGILGTPSILMSTLGASTISEQGKKYGLVYHIDNEKDLMKRIDLILANKNVKAEWAQKVKKMLQEKVDMTEILVKIIDNL